ncbi:MAG: hypothetical protein C0459_06380 [Chitinophaga sp.]|jgi:hypothetical protein|nr:hypothetical protein [Chitinophaga sp.]
MKKVLVLATAALLVSGVSFAQDKTKAKEKCTKECCKKDGKDCCKKDAKTAEKKTTATKTKA